MPIDAHALDSPWARLPILLPLSFLLCLLALIRLLPHPEDKLEPLSPPPPPIAAEIVELPPEAPPAPKTLPTPVPTRSTPIAPRPAVTPTPPSTPVTSPSSPAPPAPSSSPPKPAPQSSPSSPAPASTGHGQSEIRAARALIHPLPVIPDELRASALNETAVARFHIDRSGHVSVELLHATQNTRLNRLILDTLATWKFFPAIADGHPIDSNQDLDIHINVQ